MTFFSFGCHSSRSLTVGEQSDSGLSDGQKIRYTLIYVIHGDADYLYHNTEGDALQADEEKLREAISVGKTARNGQVFIFHQQPEDKILWIFPKKDRRFLHFKKGKLVHRQKYSPPQDSHIFAKEASLFKKYSTRQQNRRFFLYFGHEIPQDEQRGYFISRPQVSMSANSFASGAQQFLAPDEEYALSILSTCENGTPVMMQEWKGIADYVLASPQDLHLSHIDTKPLLQLESKPDLPTSEVAQKVAEQTFSRLNHFIQTVISLSIYDLDQVGRYVSTLAEKSMDMTEKSFSLRPDNSDCSVFPFWEQRFDKGVEVYYQAPKFGPGSDRKAHSGWSCKSQ